MNGRFVCPRCGSKSRPHWGLGLCQRCYNRYYRCGKGGSPYRDFALPKISDLDLSYVAGIVDTGACIGFVKGRFDKVGRYQNPKIILKFSNRRRLLFEGLQKLFGCGHIRSRVRKNKAGGKVVGYFYTISSRLQVREILKVVAPFLIIRRGRAMAALRWIDRNPYRGYNEWPIPERESTRRRATA